MKKRILSKSNSHQYANMRLAGGNDFALLFLIQGGSLALLQKHLRLENKIGLTAVEVKTKSFHYLLRILEMIMIFLIQLLKIKKRQEAKQVDDF